MLTKPYSGWGWQVSEFTNLYRVEFFAKFPYRKPSCRTPRQCVYRSFLSLLCFRRFPAALWQLGTPVRIRNHFPGRSCGKAHSLRPSRTRFPHKAWPARPPSSMKGNGRAYANPSCAWEYNEKILARQKGRHGTPFASYCLERVDNKVQRAI